MRSDFSAGAFVSPKILMLSGVGPADHLRNLGIPIRADLPESVKTYLTIFNFRHFSGKD